MNLLDRGDCSSATSPMVIGETTPVLSNAAWALSTDFYRSSPSSYKFTKTAVVAGYVDLVDNNSSVDLHGIVPGITHWFQIWVHIPSASGILGSEVRLQILDFEAAAWGTTSQSAANVYDQFQFVQVCRMIRAGATGAVVRLTAAGSALPGEYFYCDDLDLSNSVAQGIVVPSLLGKRAELILSGKRSGMTIGGN